MLLLPVILTSECEYALQVEGIIWALKFPSLASYRDFAEHLDDYAFENEFGVPNDDVVSRRCMTLVLLMGLRIMIVKRHEH